MKISEEKALEEYPIDIIPDDDTMGFTSSDRNEVIRLGYIQGYDQAMQDFMEKAEGFLTGRIVSCFRVSLTEQQTPFLDFNIKDIVEQFKNYMEDESK